MLLRPARFGLLRLVDGTSNQGSNAQETVILHPVARGYLVRNDARTNANVVPTPHRASKGNCLTRALESQWGGEFEDCWTRKVSFQPNKEDEALSKEFQRFEMRGDDNQHIVRPYGVDEDNNEGPAHLIPQLIIATNNVIKDSPTRSRTKWLDINHVISFSRDRTDPETAEREHDLRRFWEADSRLFDYFAPLYLRELSAIESGERRPTLDELSLGRRVFRDLFRAAGRDPPDWLLDSPVEDVFPAIRLELQKFIHLGQVDLYEKDGNPVIEFGDVTWDEIERIVSQLPGVFEPNRRGKTLEIKGQKRRFYRLIGLRPKHRWFGRKR